MPVAMTRGAVLLSCLVSVLICPGAWGQGLGPEAFGLPAYFGMNSPVSTRHLGMGTPIACLDGDQFANPAFAASRETDRAALRVVTTDLDAGPRLTSVLANYGRPLTAGLDGWHVTWLSLDSSSGGATLQGVGPITAELSEDALLVDYGRIVGEDIMAGICILGYEKSEFSLNSAAGPALASFPARADYGARAGLAYEWRPGDYMGITASYAQIKVHHSGALLGGAGSTVFHCSQIALGASGHVTPEVVALAEFRRGSTQNGGAESSVNTWHLGAEYRHPAGFAVRAGLADESPTFGLTYTDGRWSADYAYIRDWNDDAVSALFGGSDTHSLQAMYRW